jgi:hypothetical protein
MFFCFVFPFGLNDKGIDGMILDINRNLFLLYGIQTSSRVHPVSCTVITNILALELEQPESEADHSSSSCA